MSEMSSVQVRGKLLLTHLSSRSVSRVSVTFSIAFTVLAAFELRGIFTMDSPMATNAFIALGSVLTFSPLMHSLVAQDLLVLSLRL